VPSQRFQPARRRPRVAGRSIDGSPVRKPIDGSTVREHNRYPTDRPGAVTLDDPAHPINSADSTDSVEEATQPGAPRRRLTMALVGSAAVLVIALGFAAWFRGEANQLLDSAPKSNSALLDAGATAQVSGQVRDAVERVFSYDFARLDDNERAANDVVTGQFARDYRQQFARVRELAPGQQAVVVATVPALAVKVLDGDRAIVMVFIDQQANRGGQAQPLIAAGRLSVTAQRIAGNWKIADVEPF
jgi:Mce-associated membrane protein